MKRILICSPVRGGVKPVYVRALISILFADWKGEATWNWAATSGTSVAMARDELAMTAIRSKYDEIIFWDIDCHPEDPNTMLAMISRLMSHDVDIVGAQYVGHNFLSRFHGAVASDGAQPDERGLLPMAQIPLGLSKIKVSTFTAMQAFHPHLRYQLRQTQDTEAKTDMFEFFPNGIVGPCSAQGKLDRIKEVLKDYGKYANNFAEYLENIHAIVHDDNYASNYLLGEDFYFCKLAREAGLGIYIDNNIIVPHESGVRLPVTNSQLLAALGEEWRWGDRVMASEIHHLIEGLRTRFAHDHV